MQQPIILIVDDNLDTVDILAVFLKSIGFQTLTAYDGVEALEVIRQERPDLIVLDINMPRLNGIQVLSRLKKIPHCSSVPVIIYTARDSLNHPHIKLTGSIEFIPKGNYSLAEVGLVAQRMLMGEGT